MSGLIKRVSTAIACAVLYATFAGADGYVDGEILLKCVDVLEIDYEGGVPVTGDEELDELINDLSVYDINELYDFLPTEPIDDPNGKWDWYDWQDMIAAKRFDTYYSILYDDPNYDPPTVAALFEECSSVEFAEPNYLMDSDFIPNDSFFVGLWNLHNTGQDPPLGTYNVDINAPEGWEYWPLPFRDATVAVVDTGADLDHPDLAANLLPGINLINLQTPPQDEDDFSHGTHVSGIIAAVAGNYIGVAGIGYNKVKVIPCKVSVNGGIAAKPAAAAIIWAAREGADVINMSFSGPAASRVVHKAIQGAYGLGVVLCAAMGNDCLRTVARYPACYKEVIGVSAIDCDSELADYSNFGPEVEFTAPGGEGNPTEPTGILSTFKGDAPFGNYNYLPGTSMACPHVSAICALIQAHFPYAIDPPSARPAEVRYILKNSCIDQPPAGWDEYFGWGRVSLEKAMENIFADLALWASSDPGGGEIDNPVNDTLPAVWSLRQNFPNPARGSTTFSFDVPASVGSVATALEVYDIAGRCVAVVTRGNLGPGEYNFSWDCATTTGDKVPPGVYIYRLRAGERVFARKLVVSP